MPSELVRVVIKADPKRPTYGEPSTAASLASVTEFLDRMDSLTGPLPPHQRVVAPILTPRFVPTCSDELLRGLAALAKARGVKVQSHMCESRDQMAWVEGTRGKADEVVFDEVRYMVIVVVALTPGRPPHRGHGASARHILSAGAR